MTELTKQSIVEQIKTQLTDTGISQRKFSKQLGISDAQLSNMISGKHNLISESMWNKVRAALGTSREGWKIVRTSNFATCEQLCSDAQHNKRMLGISSSTGYGKSKALLTYAKSNQNVAYVLCDCLMSQKSFLAVIAKAFGLETAGTKQQMMDRITSAMQSMGNALLILDDLGKVNDRIYRLIQLFYDRTEGHAGIVIAGVPFLRNYVEKMANKDKMGFRELVSRIEYWQGLRSPQPSEVASICQANGLYDEDVIRFIVNASVDFRTVRSMVVNALRIAGNRPVNLDIMEGLNVRRAS